MDPPKFVNGDFDTHFIKTYFTDPSVLDRSCEKEAEIAALLARHLQTQTLHLKRLVRKLKKLVIGRKIKVTLLASTLQYDKYCMNHYF